MPLTVFFDADLRDMSWMDASRHFTGKKDVWSRSGQVPVLKTLIVGLNIFDITPTAMWTL